MKYLDQVCGLRLKTTVKIISIIGMVASLIGFSVAVNRLTKMSAKSSLNETTDSQNLINDTSGAISEGYLISNQETGISDDSDSQETTLSPDVVHVPDEDSTEATEDIRQTEYLEEESSGSGEIIARSKREVQSADNGTGTSKGLVTDSVTPPPTESSSINVVIDYDMGEPSQSSVSTESSLMSSTPETDLHSSTVTTTTTTTTTSPITEKEIENVTTTTETEKSVEDDVDLPDSKKIPAPAEDKSVQIDGKESDAEETAKMSETEHTTDKEHDHPESSEHDDKTSTDGDDDGTAEDEDYSGPSRASLVVTGAGVPICLFGFVANAVLLHSAKKAEKKPLLLWILWAMTLFMFQVVAMIVNLHDLSPYIFSNIMLTMLNVGAGYVVFSYRKQLSDPSSYDLKNIEMNGYSMNKGYMELDKGASGSSAGGDNNV